MQTIAQIQAASTAELVAFWNANNEKQIKKFSDRATALARCVKLGEQLGLPADDTPEAEPVAQEEVQEVAHVEVNNDDEVGNGAMAALAAMATGSTARNDDEARANAAALWNGPSRQIRISNDEPGEAARRAAAEAAAAARGRASNSAGVAASWSDPEVAAARLTRHHVQVTPEGGTPQQFRSVNEAFRVFRLPVSKHIRFRLKLKKSGAETFEHDGKSYAFVLVEIEADAE